MAEILILGGDAEAAARDMGVALREIFGVEPWQTTRGAGEQAPGTRTLIEIAVAIALGWAPATVAVKQVYSEVAERLHRLTAKAEAVEQETGASILIDPGDGKPIPLHQANRETIRTALERLEQHLKS